MLDEPEAADGCLSFRVDCGLFSATDAAATLVVVADVADVDVDALEGEVGEAVAALEDVEDVVAVGEPGDVLCSRRARWTAYCCHGLSSWGWGPRSSPAFQRGHRSGW